MATGTSVVTGVGVSDNLSTASAEGIAILSGAGWDTGSMQDFELAWRSLGLIRAPGRIFELIDSGPDLRIDGLDMVD